MSNQSSIFAKYPEFVRCAWPAWPQTKAWSSG